MVGLQTWVLFIFVSSTILPALATDVVSQAISRSVLINRNGLTFPGPLGHSFLVAFLASLEGEEFGLLCGRRLVVLALGVLRVAGASRGCPRA